MNSHRGEPPKITGEIPVSLNLLSVVNGLSVTYMKVKGLFYLIIGTTWLFIQSPAREAGLAWLDFLTPWMVGILWVLSGIIAVFSAFFGSHASKRLGFFVLIITPTVIGAYFLISWMIYLTPLLESEGYERGVVSTASYWAYAASAYVMARIYASSSGGIEHNTRGVRR